ncbi:MAG TPA: tetratricopeptide repeat protein [Candidatus Angelobacter sp.]|nr:tetratricopeptide repeat protein [Candidatus Angelobacter sp.]
MRTRVLVLLIPLFLSLSTPAQRKQTPQQIGPSKIEGTVRVDGRPAPPGILVMLDYAANESTASLGRGELGRTMTDSTGKFQFTFAGQAGGDRRLLFAVSAHAAGFKDAVQILDLTGVPHGTANLEMHRDTSKDQPAIPPGGPGETINAHQPASPEAAEALRKGQQLLLEKHDAKGSIESLKKAVKLDPQFGLAQILLGTAYLQQREWPEAQSAFEKAAKLEPGNAQALLGLAVCLNAQQDFKGAEKTLEHSLQLDPKSAEAHYELGKSFWGMGKWQEAEPHAVQAIALNKDFPPVHVLMGNIYLRKHDAASALKEFNEYLRLDPQGPFAQPTRELVEKLQKAVGQR